MKEKKWTNGREERKRKNRGGYGYRDIEAGIGREV
jgi:hypothetical protein